jgi:hypothetical protein
MNTRMFAIAMIALLMKGTEMSGGSHSALVAASVLGSAAAAQSLDQPATVTPDGSGRSHGQDRRDERISSESCNSIRSHCTWTGLCLIGHTLSLQT